jgi:hypothetical protein
MTAAFNLVQLGKLIADTHDWAAAKAFKSFQPSDRDKAMIANKGAELLRIFPKSPGTAALMSAAFAAHLERDLNAPIHVVAGSLHADGQSVFESGRAARYADIFSADSPQWNGHVWVMIGPWVADISIFRIAFSPDSPQALARHVAHHFAPTTGMIFERWRHTRQVGFDYVPQYVLSTDQVTHLLRGAQDAIAGGTASPR